MMKKYRAVLLALICSGYLQAQINAGMSNSNFAGIGGALINPSSLADSKIRWDVNLATISTVFDNDFVYIPRQSVPVLGFRRIIDGVIHTNLFYTHFDPSNPNKPYNFTLSNEILGPSFNLEIPRGQQIGLTISARTFSNIQNVPGHVAQSAFAFLQEKDLWNQNFQDNGTKLNTMGWLEYAVHYAAVIYTDGQNEWKAGISLKYLQGLFAAYVKNTHLNYNIENDSAISMTNSSVDYGRTDYDSYRKIKGYNDLNHGSGFGASLGMTFVHLRNPSAYTYEKDGQQWLNPDKSTYVYRIGLSLLDLGAINYKRQAAAYHLETAAGTFSDWSNTTLRSNQQVDRTLSAIFYNGDSSRSFAGDHFKMGLPTSLSVQADWNFYKSFYANLTIIKGFGHGNNQGAVRPDLYSLTPRYETKWLEFSLPMSVIYYHRWQPRIGLAVRAGYFFFGGDSPATLFGTNNLERMDFYFGLHYFVHEKKFKPRTPLFPWKK
jgi:hypothetical protein